MQRYQPRKVYFFGPDGKPLSQIESYMYWGGGQRDFVRGSSLELTDLAPDRLLEVKFTHLDRQPGELRALALVPENGPAQVGLLADGIRPPGNDPRAIAVQLHASNMKIKGRLIDQDGKPVARKYVSFTIAGAETRCGPESQQDGTFESTYIFANYRYHLESIGPDAILLDKIDDFVMQPNETVQQQMWCASVISNFQKVGKSV